MSTITVRKRNGSWEYRIYMGKIDGKSQRICKSGFATKQEARRAAANAANGEIADPSVKKKEVNLTYGAYLDSWVNDYCIPNLKKTSVHDYMKRIENVIKPRIGAYEIHDLTPMILQQFIMDIFNDGYTRNAIATIKGIVTSSLRYAVIPAGILTSSPAIYIKLPLPRAKPAIKPQEHKRIPLTPEQWQQLMIRFPRYHPSHIALNLGYHLGLRLGEAFGLCWEDVDFEAQTVSINRQVQYDDDRKCWYFTDPKYDSFRTIHMDRVITALLRDEHERQQAACRFMGLRYRQICIDDDLRFSKTGTPVHLVNTREDGTYIQPRTTQNISNVAHKELNLPRFDFHTLRHTHATMLIEAGADLADVQERLGHTKALMTARYVHDTDAQRTRTIRILNALYAPQKIE